MKKKGRKKLFDRAFDKAAAQQPGQPNPLTEEEERVLLAHIDSWRERVWKPFQRRLKKLRGL